MFVLMFLFIAFFIFLLVSIPAMFGLSITGVILIIMSLVENYKRKNELKPQKSTVWFGIALTLTSTIILIVLVKLFLKFFW